MGKTEITSNHEDLSHPAKGFTPYQCANIVNVLSTITKYLA